MEPVGHDALHDEPAAEGVQGKQGGEAVDRPAGPVEAEPGWRGSPGRRRAGFDRHFTKPVNIAELEAFVDAAGD